VLGSSILEPQNIRFTSKQLSTLRHPWCVQKAAPLACLSLAALSACSRQKPISQIELQSKLRSAASIAAEAGTFIDYIGKTAQPINTPKVMSSTCHPNLLPEPRIRGRRSRLLVLGITGVAHRDLNFSNHSGLPDWLKMEALARRYSFVVSLGSVAKCVPLNADRKF